MRGNEHLEDEDESALDRMHNWLMLPAWPEWHICSTAQSFQVGMKIQLTTSLE